VRLSESEEQGRLHVALEGDRKRGASTLTQQLVKAAILPAPFKRRPKRMRQMGW